MKERVITAILALQLFIIVMLSKNLNIMTIAVYILAIIGLKEFFRANKEQGNIFYNISMFFATIYYGLGLFKDEVLAISSILIGFFIICSVGMLTYSKKTLKSITTSIMGIIYVPVLFSFILKIMASNNYGIYLVWFIFLISWCTDTSACLIGKMVGKRKVTPVLSPNKSLEGFIGGIVTTTILSTLYGIILVKLNLVNIDNFIVMTGIMGLIGSMISQIGDLMASAIKRSNNIKDYGTLFPGHGGVLDRFDSVLFVAPAVYVVSLFL